MSVHEDEFLARLAPVPENNVDNILGPLPSIKRRGPEKPRSEKTESRTKESK